MTEYEWEGCTDPDRLYLDQAASTPIPWRKLRLFACGCCRMIWDHITDPRCRNAIEIMERCADRGAAPGQLATDYQFGAAFDAVELACDEIITEYPQTVAQGAAYAAQMALRSPSDVAYPVARVLTEVRPNGGFQDQLKANLVFIAELLKDIFGNPYRTIVFDPRWQTEEVQRLVNIIYEERAFFRMSELADTLEEAGCNGIDILDHCRSKRGHARGCWLVDLLLGKGRV